MRIVGGSHRGRAVSAPPGDETRPTTDRVREALFNMLLHSPRLLNREGKARLEGAIVLDPFAGSGALSFEALSRGASHAYLFEIDAMARRTVLHNAAELGLADRITLRGADCCQPGAPPGNEPGNALGPADIVFLDPPYRSDLGTRALAALDRHGWLKPEALAVVETDARNREPAHRDSGFAVPPGFALLEERQQGPARLTFLLKQS